MGPPQDIVCVRRACVCVLFKLLTDRAYTFRVNYLYSSWVRQHLTPTPSYLTTVCVLLRCLCFFLLIVSSEMSLFFPIRVSLYHCRFLLVWRVRRTFFLSGWCLSTLRSRAGFLTSTCVRIQSKSINYIIGFLRKI